MSVHRSRRQVESTEPALPLAPAIERITIAQYREIVARGLTVKPKRRAHPEEDLHRACFELVVLMSSRHAILRWMAHYPSGGKRPRGEAGKLRALGTKPGVPDLVLPRRRGIWSGLAVELKSPDGKLSGDQREWLEGFQEEGYLTAVCRTLDAFQDVVSLFLSGALPVAQPPQACLWSTELAVRATSNDHRAKPRGSPRASRQSQNGAVCAIFRPGKKP